jgi:hypothetical protein
MTDPSSNTLLAIDPGRNKCGIAILDSSGNVLMRKESTPAESSDILASLIDQYKPSRVVIGDGTGSSLFVSMLEKLMTNKPELIREKNTTLEARELAWSENPPSGIMRYLPRLFWPTPKDLDSWAAIVAFHESKLSIELSYCRRKLYEVHIH